MIEPTVFFKCLSEPLRLNSTLLILKEGELCVCELMEALKETQPKISRHLAQLRSCGVLTHTRREQWVYYSLNTNLPDWCRQTLQTLCNDTDQINQFYENLNAMQNRPTCC